MSKNYALSLEEKDGTAIIRMEGYFDIPAATDLVSCVDELLCRQRKKFVLDFTATTVLCSRGIGCLMELVDKVIDEFDGALAFSGLDPLKRRVLDFISATERVAVTRTAAEGVEVLARM